MVSLVRIAWAWAATRRPLGCTSFGALWCGPDAIASAGALRLTTYLGALEEGVRGRQTGAKALIAVAAEGWRRHRTSSDAHDSERLWGQLDGLRRRVGRTRQRGPHGRLAGLRATRKRRLSPRGELPGRATGTSLSTSRGVVTEALDTGYASRSRQPRASRLLPEFTFRFNRRKSRSRGKLFYRLGSRRATGALQIAGRRHRIHVGAGIGM